MKEITWMGEIEVSGILNAESIVAGSLSLVDGMNYY